VPEYIVAGEARLTSEDILVGTELAKDLGASVGDKVNVTTASGRNRILTVTGIFDFGNKGANQRNTYVALRTAQSLLNLIGGVTTIDLTVVDVYAADVVARDIEATLPVEADSWIRTNAQFFTAVQAQQATNTMIRLFVGLSVAFGIAAVLIVSVIQRSKDIGILRAMGTARGQILDGSELFPLILEPSLFVVAAALATVTGVAAAMAPALRAANLDPVVAIRG
jgi:lipoprotein-releasing system permease protein